MKLERITVVFAPEEDRLRGRVQFVGPAEVGFWLTRRLVKRLWPVLIQIARARPEIQAQANPEVREAMLGIEHERALQKVQFSAAPAEGATPDEPARTHPLGDTPFLVTRVRSRRNEQGRTVLSLMPKEGQGIDLALGDDLLHGLMKLIRNAVAKADWDLELEVASLETSTRAPDDPQPSLN